MAQVIIGGSPTTIAASTSRYVALMGHTPTVQTASTLVNEVIPANGKIKLLAFRPSASPGGSLASATVLVNNSATTLTCGTTNAAIAHDSTHEINVSIGDLVSVQIDIAAGATSRFYSHSVVFTPNTPGQCILMGNSNTLAPAANNFVGICNAQSPGPTESVVRYILPESNGIFKNLIVNLDTVPTGTTSETFTFFNNGVAGNNVVTITSGGTTGQDVTHNDTILNTGHTASVKLTTTGTPPLSPFRWGIVYCSPVPGNFLLMSSTGVGTMSNAGSRFINVSGTRTVQTAEANETYVSNAFTAKSIVSRLEATPGAGTGWDLCLRKNTTDTSLLINLSGSSVTGITTTDVSVSLDDIIDFRQGPNPGSPTIGSWKISMLGYLNDASNPNFFQFF